MDTSLEGKKINWIYIISYGFVAELIPILAVVLHVYVWGNLIHPEYNLSFTQEYMTRVGVPILQSVGFLSYAAIAFWIAKRSRVRTLYNGFRLLLVGIIVELIFYWIIGVGFEFRYAFSLITYPIAIILATLTPPILKGKQTHLKDWDARKDEEYHKKKRK